MSKSVVALVVAGGILAALLPPTSYAGTALSARRAIAAPGFTGLASVSRSLASGPGERAVEPADAPVPAPSPTATVTPAPRLLLGRYYLALGDSYAYGYLTEDQPADPDCRSPKAPGFVCVFWRYLKEIEPGLTLNNLAQSGADSCQMAGAGHRCYSTSPSASSLDAAVSFLQQHSGAVSPITLTIGGNDLLELAPQALNDPTGTAKLLPDIYSRYRGNLDLILSRLRASAPTATVIVTTQPNPFGGLGSPPLPAGLPELFSRALDGLNQIMKDEAPKYGARVADTATAFDSYPGGGSALTWLLPYLPQGKIEIHPTPLGYKVYGEALISASGFRLPIRARLEARTLGPGKKETVSGVTIDHGVVTVRIDNPHMKPVRRLTKAGAKGRFAAVFRASGRVGTGTVKACVHDAGGHGSCAAPLPFVVR